MTQYNIKMIDDNVNSGKKRLSGLFQSIDQSKNSIGRVKSCSIISNQMKIQSPRGGQLGNELKALKESHGAEMDQATIKETNKESSSESEDETSSSEGSSSVEGLIEGDESEAAMYKKLQEAQEKIMNGESGEESKIDPKDVNGLVDKNMIDLLRACSMLRRPTTEEIE